MLAAGKAAADEWGRQLLRRAAVCTLLILAGILCKSLRHSPHDQDVYLDSLALGRALPKSSVVSFRGFSDDQHSDAAISYYLARWASISVNESQPHEFLLLPIADSIRPPPGYRETPTDMRLYRLFQRSDSMNLATEPAGRIDFMRIGATIEPGAATHLVK